MYAHGDRVVLTQPDAGNPSHALVGDGRGTVLSASDSVVEVRFDNGEEAHAAVHRLALLPPSQGPRAIEAVRAIVAAGPFIDPDDDADGDEQAARDVARRMDIDEAGLLVEDLAGAAGALSTALRNVETSGDRQVLAGLLQHARTMRAAMDAETELAR